MRNIIIGLLLTLMSTVGWTETWVCETFIVDGNESTGKGAQQVFKVSNGSVTNTFGSKLKILHNDKGLLVATSVGLTSKGYDRATFTYLMLDKERRIHVYDFVTPPGDATRDEGPCVFVD